MAKFYVGQRVRFVKATTEFGRLRMSEECRIVELGVLPTFEGPLAEAYLESSDGTIGAAFLWQIEPILDQKHEACDEDFKRSMDELLERECVSA